MVQACCLTTLLLLCIDPSSFPGLSLHRRTAELAGKIPFLPNESPQMIAEPAARHCSSFFIRLIPLAKNPAPPFAGQ